MSPLEINKMIAGIKRLNWVSSNTTNPALIGHDELPTSDRLHPPKNWAENIADAWELFEEPGYAQLTKLELYGEGIKHLCVISAWDEVEQDFIYKAKADTAPLVICLAWLKWKGES